MKRSESKMAMADWGAEGRGFALSKKMINRHRCLDVIETSTGIRRPMPGGEGAFIVQTTWRLGHEVPPFYSDSSIS